MIDEIKDLFSTKTLVMVGVVVVAMVGGVILGNKVKFLKNMFNNGRTW